MHRESSSQISFDIFANAIFRLEEIRDLWQSRWQWFHQPLHAMGCLLHPLWRREEQFHDRELRDGWHTYITGIYPDPAIQDALMDDLNVFRYG